jgi:hypothetical protein
VETGGKCGKCTILAVSTTGSTLPDRINYEQGSSRVQAGFKQGSSRVQLNSTASTPVQRKQQHITK